MHSRRFAARNVRATGLLALAALGLHQLRYLLAYGHDAGAALEGEGHSYLVELTPLLVAIAGAAVLASLVWPALLRLAGPGLRPARVAATASAYAGGLLAVFCLQELVEGALFAGHAPGLAGVFGDGGWVAIPLAMALGFVAALAARLLDSAERRLVGALARAPLARAPRRLRCQGSAVPRRPLASLPLRFGLARRPPPPLALG